MVRAVGSCNGSLKLTSVMASAVVIKIVENNEYLFSGVIIVAAFLWVV